jgi:hypothetical protein
MDVSAFVQENKRWLIGVAIGGIAWLIGSSIIDAIYDPAGSMPTLQKLGAPREVFDGAARTALQTENEQLVAERQRLQEALAFTRGDKFLLANKGSPDEYVFQVGRGLKQAIASAANERDVAFADNAVAWDVPAGVDDIRATLFGLELLDEVQKRLFAAHDATRARAAEAVGLRTIQSLRLDNRKKGSTPMRVKAGEVDMRDLMVQEHVTFQFQADEATALAFLEACRQPTRALVIDTWQMVRPARIGDACQIKGMLHGIAWKEQ